VGFAAGKRGFAIFNCFVHPSICVSHPLTVKLEENINPPGEI